MKRTRLLGIALLSVSLLAGCKSTVTTEVNVSESGDATMSATVTFEDEAADALLADFSLEAQVREILEERTGNKAVRHSDDGLVSFSAPFPYERLEGLSGILGASSASLQSEEESATLNLVLSRPTELVDAITAANAGEVDSAALTETILKTTFVNIEVNFPGEITNSSGPNEVSVDGNQLRMESALDSFEAGTLSVTGSTKAPLVTTERLLIAGGVLLAAVIGGIFRWRRR